MRCSRLSVESRCYRAEGPRGDPGAKATRTFLVRYRGGGRNWTSSLRMPSCGRRGRSGMQHRPDASDSGAGASHLQVDARLAGGSVEPQCVREPVVMVPVRERGEARIVGKVEDAVRGIHNDGMHGCRVVHPGRFAGQRQEIDHPIHRGGSAEPDEVPDLLATRAGLPCDSSWQGWGGKRVRSVYEPFGAQPESGPQLVEVLRDVPGMLQGRADSDDGAAGGIVTTQQQFRPREVCGILKDLAPDECVRKAEELVVPEAARCTVSRTRRALRG
jgi:hypothetical protein